MDKKVKIYVLVFVYIFSILFIRQFGAYQVTYGLGWFLASLSYISLAYLLLTEGYDFAAIDLNKNFYLKLFFLCIIFRAIFLFSEPSLSRDVTLYKSWGMQGLKGLPPYGGGVSISYPPLTYFLFSFIVYLSDSILTLKIFFIIFDCFVSILLKKIGDIYFGGNKGVYIAILYALNPLSLIEIAWSGHCDPIATLFLLASFLMLLNKRYFLSGSFLGISVLLKWYPLLLLPIYVRYVYEKKKLRGTLVFLAYFIVISLLFVEIMSIIYPGTYLIVFKELVSSGGALMYSKSLSDNTGRINEFLSLSVFDVKHAVSFTILAFCFISLGCYAIGMKKKRAYFIALIALLSLHFSLLAGMTAISILLGLGSLTIYAKMYSLIFVFIAALPLPRLLSHINSQKTEGITLPELFVFGVFLTILALPGFSPWYFTWLIPWLLLVEDKKTLFYLLWILLLIQPIAYQTQYDHFLRFSI